MGRGHPECPQRLDAISDHLIATGLDHALEMREAPLAALEQIARAHSSGFVNELRAAIEPLAENGEREGKSMGRVASELLAAALASPLDVPAPPFSWHASDLGAPLVDLAPPTR